MPHFTIEYSANMDARTDIKGLCDEIRAAALKTGFFELGAVRVRAIRCASYAIADNLPENAFAHIRLRLGVGRTGADKKVIGEAIFTAADRFLSPLFKTPHFALSFEIQEIDEELSWKKNAIHPRTRALEQK